jgi:hypothetical protein
MLGGFAFARALHFIKQLESALGFAPASEDESTTTSQIVLMALENAEPPFKCKRA